MTQTSYPQPGLTPADGPDCGAYTANEWRGFVVARMRSGGMVQTGAAAPPGMPPTPPFPNIGVFRCVDNLLAVSSPGASQISVASGAGLVDGTMFINDDAITAIAITNPAANPRIDRVIIRQNYSAVDYTSPNAPSQVVTANTARIAIISGAEAGVPTAPTLTQDQDRATYWDTPLAQYQIAVGGAISNLTDEREWVDAETKRFFAPAVFGYNITDTANISLGAYLPAANCIAGIEMPDTKRCFAHGTSVIPNDFISGMDVSGVVYSLASGNIYGQTYCRYAACGQVFNTHNQNSGYAAEAITQDFNECVHTLSTTLVATGDVLRFIYERDGAHANDTIGNTVWVSGFEIEYLGWGRK